MYGGNKSCRLCIFDILLMHFYCATYKYCSLVQCATALCDWLLSCRLNLIEYMFKITQNFGSYFDILYVILFCHLVMIVQGILLNAELAWRIYIKNLCYIVYITFCMIEQVLEINLFQLSDILHTWRENYWKLLEFLV
jgi:hypothetical protein